MRWGLADGCGGGGLGFISLALELFAPWWGWGDFQSLVIFIFIDSGPETAWNKAPFIWNLRQCLDLWAGEINHAVCQRQRLGGLVTEHLNFILIKVISL